MTVLIDGKMVPGSELDPAKHKFIGMFRYPHLAAGRGNLFCPCGTVLQIVEEEFHHWLIGHFDVPQYVTIDEKRKGAKDEQGE